MMFYIDLAARTEAADHLHVCCRRLPAGAEEFVWLVFFERVFLVVLADLTVFPAGCPVLFGILNNGFC